VAEGCELQQGQELDRSDPPDEADQRTSVKGPLRSALFPQSMSVRSQRIRPERRRYTARMNGPPGGSAVAETPRRGAKADAPQAELIARKTTAANIKVRNGKGSARPPYSR
jgi:hypothetical protein